ncbi:MAG: signal peptide peptidase SppA [candidate division WOR-3 bacterium]
MLKIKFIRLLIIVIFLLVAILFVVNKVLLSKEHYYYIQLNLSEIKEEQVNLKPINIFPESETFLTLLYKLYKIKNDEKFKLLILDLTNYNFNWEQTYEMRKLIKSLREKREIICYADGYKQKAYYLATACSKIYMPSGNIVEIPGFYSEILFFRELLDSLKIKIFPIQFEEYKSALEPLTNKEPSKYYKEQIENVLKYHYDELKNALIERGIKEPDSLINKVAFFYSKDALNHKLIDDIKYLDDIEEISKNLKLKKGKLPKLTNFSKKKIAILSLEGPIVPSDQYDPINKTTTIGKNTTEIIKKIRKDKNIIAVLIRVNSPGGSSAISDMIAREIKLLSKEKEVVISMGRAAASGGYYISAYANKIFAEPLTITGSIGVIFAKLATENFYRDKLFINPYILKEGEHADIFSSKELTKEEEKGMKELIYKIYEDFINVVSEGRKISKDSVKNIAKGKIYLGTEAKNIGLVDTIGGFLDALNYLKSKYKDASIEIYNRSFEINLDILGLRTNLLNGISFYEPLFLFGEFIKP